LGYSHAEIAETMGISQSTSRRWVSAALKEIPREAADEVRGMMLAIERCNR
jgi:DNA-directed RNA polymerase specialized sigma24 family protein